MYGLKNLSENQGKAKAAPLRCAPVGMTILLCDLPISSREEHYFLANELSSRPERSVVEGPALAFPSHSRAAKPVPSVGGAAVTQSLFHLGFVLHWRRIGLTPRCVIPGNRLQSFMAWLEDHRRLCRFTFHRVETDLYLAAGIDPMAKKRSRAIPRVLCNRCCAIRPQA